MGRKGEAANGGFTEKRYSLIHAEFLVLAFSEHLPPPLITTAIVVADDNNPGTGMRRLSVSGSTFWHFRHGLAVESLLHKLRKEVGEWRDALPHASFSALQGIRQVFPATLPSVVPLP